jgi:hypothetical protein
VTSFCSSTAAEGWAQILRLSVQEWAAWAGQACRGGPVCGMLGGATPCWCC